MERFCLSRTNLHYEEIERIRSLAGRPNAHVALLAPNANMIRQQKAAAA